MESISIRCKSCKHQMKFSGDKAGKKARCSKCGKLTLIEAETVPPGESGDDGAAALLLVDDSPAAPPPDEPAPAPAPPPQKDDDDEGEGEYGVAIDKELEERQRVLKEQEAAKARQKKERQKLPEVTRKLKPIDNADEWSKVRVGLLFIVFGVGVWLATHLLLGLYLIIGSIELPEYAYLVSESLEHRKTEELPGEGGFWDIDMFTIYMGMIAGRNFNGLAQTCVILSTLLFFVQAALWGLGYLFCLPVPRRFGMFGNVLTMLGLLLFNVLVVFFFKFLPVMGVYNYIMIPYIVPEIALTEYNTERMIPINILWSGAPFWENFANVIFKFLLYLEPTIMCVFLWSLGCCVKDKDIQSSGRSGAQIILGTFFALLAFHLLSLCGASNVLITVLRVIYGVWYGFLILFTIYYVRLLLQCRTVLDQKIHPKNVLEE
jgi:hypothetical protein